MFARRALFSQKRIIQYTPRIQTTLSARFLFPLPGGKYNGDKLYNALSDIPDGPLGGIIAVGLTGQISGSEALSQLVRHGAMGIKVEQAEGDPKRSNATSTAFNTYNAGTYSVVFNSTAEDIDLKFHLFRNAHVIVDNRSSVARKNDAVLQEAMRERASPLVYCAISGFGPDNDEKAYDRVIQAVSGMADLNADHNNNPQLINFPLIDISAGKEAAKQIGFALTWLNSLTDNEKKNLGFVSLEISMFAVAVDLLANSIATYIDTQKTASSIVPFGFYDTKSERIAIAVAKDSQFSLLCDLLDITDLSKKFPTNNLRQKNRELVEKTLSEKLMTRSANEWEALLKTQGIPAGIVTKFSDSIEKNYGKYIRHDNQGEKYIHSAAATSNCFPRPVSLRGAPILGQDGETVRALVDFLKSGNALSPLLFKSVLAQAQAMSDPNNKAGFYARKVHPSEINFEAEQCGLSWAEPQFFYAKKIANVFAVPAENGEKVSTIINGFKMTDNIARKGDIKITTMQGDQYFISKKIFDERYQNNQNHDGSYSAKPIVMKLCKTTQDIRLLGPWGNPQFLRAGSVVTRRSNFDVYGIDIDSFRENYRICNEKGEQPASHHGRVPSQGEF